MSKKKNSELIIQNMLVQSVFPDLRFLLMKAEFQQIRDQPSPLQKQPVLFFFLAIFWILNRDESETSQTIWNPSTKAS